VKRGHVTGTKVEKPGASNWYAAIEEANIQAAEDAERALVTALAIQVGNAVRAMPEAAARITKAAALVQAGDVYPLSSGNFLVGSQSDPLAAHLVVRRWAWECDCLHMQHDKSLCAHAIAAMLTVKIGAAYQPAYELPQAA
jgi:hypothetical protein